MIKNEVMKFTFCCFNNTANIKTYNWLVYFTRASDLLEGINYSNHTFFKGNGAKSEKNDASFKLK